MYQEIKKYTQELQSIEITNSDQWSNLNTGFDMHTIDIY